MMNQFDVNIRVPPQEAKSDIICISGVPTNVEAAKEGLAEKVVELEKEISGSKKQLEEVNKELKICSAKFSSVELKLADVEKELESERLLTNELIHFNYAI